MSSPAGDGPQVPSEKKKGLSKMVSRMKTVLKRSDGSKRLSFSAKPTAAGPSTAPLTSTPLPTTTETAPATKTESTPGKTIILRSQIDAARAAKLSERFAVSIEPLSTGPDREAIRVEKPIRMRIHRSCHKCNNTFGGNKICSSCAHIRCKQCPRFPPKTVGIKEEKAEKQESKFMLEPDNYFGLRETIVLTRPNPKPGCQPLVRKKPTQRVRRNCHECGSLFPGGTKICPKESCGHIRCADCPRDPAKKKKYPDGYPGDSPSSNTAIPVKYTCHKCTKVFPPVPHPESKEGIAMKESDAPPLECTRCGHAMCDGCPRAKPRRVDPVPDEEVVRAVRRRLEGLGLETKGKEVDVEGS